MVHRLSHPGSHATYEAIRKRFVWPNIKKDVINWVKLCLPCQRAKIQRHIHNTPERIPVPDNRFQHVHLDIVGPLPISQDF